LLVQELLDDLLLDLVRRRVRYRVALPAGLVTDAGNVALRSESQQGDLDDPLGIQRGELAQDAALARAVGARRGAVVDLRMLVEGALEDRQVRAVSRVGVGGSEAHQSRCSRIPRCRFGGATFHSR